MSKSDTTAEADFQPRNILVPIDFSPLSQKAVRYAQAFVEEFGGVIHLVHIVEPLPVLMGIDGAAMPLVDPREAVQLERELAKLAKALPAGSLGRIIVRPGLAVDDIISVAKELRVDLIVVPTHGHSGMQRVFFGSTAEGIIRWAPCAVLVLRAEEHEFVISAKTASKRFAFAVKSILVPIDFSDASRKALGYAVSFARRFQAKLVCVHVIEIVPYADREVTLVSELELIRNSVFAATERTLQDFLKAETEQIPCENVLTFGSAAREIIQIAEDRKPDLILMGAHGKAAPGRFLLGSTTERVVRHIHIPALVVRKPEQ